MLLAIVVFSLLLVVRDLSTLTHPSEQVLKGTVDITRIGDGLLLSMSMLIVMYSRLFRSRLLSYGVLAVFAVGLIASAARSPLVALILTLLICVCLIPSRAGVVSRRQIVIAMVLAAVIAIPVLKWMEELPSAERKVELKQQELSSFLTGSWHTGGTIGARVNFAGSAIEALKEHPIFGLGVGGWSIYYSEEQLYRYPHDFVLEVAAEQGLLGVSLLSALLLVLFRSAKRLVVCRLFAFVFPTLAFIVIANIMTGDIENRQLWMWFGIVAGTDRLALSVRHRRESWNSRIAAQAVVLETA
jgi:O-antigen ligase